MPRYLITLEIEAATATDAAQLARTNTSPAILPHGTIAVVDADSGAEYVVTVITATATEMKPE